LKQGIQLYWKALEKKEEQKAWDMWLMNYQHMTEKDFTPFSQFYKNSRVTQVSKKPTDEILKEVEEIRQRANSNKE
jgi:hypothetical protein